MGPGAATKVPWIPAPVGSSVVGVSEMTALLRRLAAPRELTTPATVVLGLAALAVAIGGYEHAHLYHRGYREIHVIGTLFVLNTLGSLATVLLLLARRPYPFVLSSLAVSVGSIVAIVVTRTSGMFGFHESGYDTRAILTVVAEAFAVVLTVVGAVLARRVPPPRPTADAGTEPATEVFV